ncbi:MAG: glycosyltransferase family 9 protein, partial [Abditibacteriota bacterium]|nr:glycosyltransferase family 9 protein [Abditibacteriota bacterium]
PMIGIVFAASRECKYWQKEKWRAVLEYITGNLGYKCVLLGAPGDFALGEELRAGIDNTVNIAGKTSLREALAVIALCSACVAVDTAMLHFAVCQDIPTVCLYGSDVYLDQHVYKPNFLVVHKPSDPDRPCHKRCHCRGYKCMHNIDTETVLGTLEKALQNP